MHNKIGRNEPCPCGSGKKYKKCCGAQETVDFSLPVGMQTGTLLDEYFLLLQGIGMFGQSLRQFDEERHELNAAIGSFETMFSPGSLDGVPDSIFLSWSYFDLRFGKSQKTVVERFMESGYVSQLREPGPKLVRDMADSYLAFYVLRELRDDAALFEEIGTGKQWRVHCVSMVYDGESHVGDLWFGRLLGAAGAAYMFTSPYVFPPDAFDLDELRNAIAFQCSRWKEFPGRSADHSRDFIDSAKAAACFWLSRILGKPLMATPQPPAPVMVNTDGQKLHFSEVVFTIQRRENLEAALFGIKDFEYDEHAGVWVWSKSTWRRIKQFRKAIGGTVKIDGERLLAHTNSLVRALKIKKLLQQALGDAVAFEKIDAKDLASMPKLSAEEEREHAKKNAQLNATPEVRELLKKNAEDYYYKNWLRQKIPALGGLTPYQAAKTSEGRNLLQALLDDLERRQNVQPDNPYRVDVDGLRRRLNIC
ncbi:MAG: SEC-C metal-binding domain-containing protein [Candidatus Omnitrophica bacterium]|nr:SEC-C metal-binding domain-containing protein [Candidatus Omnitrophota bacterium]